jgi:PBP1b-binding outer membrane lipoprotein LpoB
MRKLLYLSFGLIMALILSSCSKDTKVILKVTVKTDKGEEPLSNAKFSLLPYNIESIQDSLKMANKVAEPPSEEEVISLRSKYEEVNTKYNDHLDEYRKAEEAVKKIKDYTSSAYKSAYKRYTAAKANNKELNDMRENARTEYIAARKKYDSDYEKWKEAAYKGLNEVIAGIRKDRGISEDYLVKTDKEGKGKVVVPGGKWWINGKERHPSKKYTWLVWNVPIEATGGVLEVPLNQGNAREWTE